MLLAAAFLYGAKVNKRCRLLAALWTVTPLSPPIQSYANVQRTHVCRSNLPILPPSISPQAIALQFVRDLSPSFTHKVTRLFRAFDRTDTKCPVTRSTAKLPLIFGTTILLVAYACSLYIATAKPAVPAVAVHAVARARLSIVAGAAALTAVALESLADWQKQHAKRLLGGESPTLATGLWRFSRHPNYFFDIVFHAAVAFAAASHASSAGALWLALAPPAAFAAVVLQATVSLEERQAKTYAANAAYMAWREETPRLLPRLPRPAATTSDVVLDDALTATADE